MITCTSCQAKIDSLEVFPGKKCLSCYSSDPVVQRQLLTMTADDLTRMWRG